MSNGKTDRPRVTPARFTRKFCAAASAIMLLVSMSVRADVPIDTPKTLTLPPSNGHRLFITNMSLYHSVDSKVLVIDGDTFRYLGTMLDGQFGFLHPSHDGRAIYHAGSFYSRGDHGEYSEVLEFYDPSTLSPTSELELPKLRAGTMNYAAMMPESAQAHYLFIQNATPASSVTVVDLKHRKVLTVIQTAGCWGIYPSLRVPGRFSSLCGDGAAITVDFDSTGKETGRKRSAKLFDPDKDALFSDAPATARGYVFMSFLGNVHLIDMDGEVATQARPWSIVTGRNAPEGWRPGGYQVVAYDSRNGQLYVLMHPHGKEGSHKDPATQIWRVDLAKHVVVARGPGEQASYIAVSQESHPLLFSLSPITGLITRFDGTTLRVLGHSPKNGLLEGGGPLFVQ